MRVKTRTNFDHLQLSDIYSLMLFVLYKVKDIPEYATLSELCYLLDGSNLTRLLTYFAGKTIKIPSESDFVLLTNALMLYQYTNIDGITLEEALRNIEQLPPKQTEKVIELWSKIIPLLNDYNIDRTEMKR